MGDAGQALDISLDLPGECFGFADVGAGRQEGINHELRPRRRREKALVHFPVADRRRDKGQDTQDDHRPTEAERQNKEFAVELKQRPRVGVGAFGRPAGSIWLEQQIAQQRGGGDR